MPLIAIGLGVLLLAVASFSALSAAELFVEAVFQRHVDLQDPRWRKRHQFGLLVVATMLVFLCLAAVPTPIVFELPR